MQSNATEHVALAGTALHIEQVVKRYGDREVLHGIDLDITPGTRLTRCESPFRAFEVLREGLAEHPDHLRLRQLAAHALARAGGTTEATRRLQALYDEGHRDTETQGLLARVTGTPPSGLLP